MTTIDRIEALVVKKDFAAAKKLCLKLKRKGDSSLRVQFALGSIALQTGRYSRAEKIFRALSKSCPNHAGVLNNLGAAIQHTGGDLDEAQTFIERSIKIDPANIPAYVGLGELYLARKKTDKAREVYASIEKIAPTHPQGPYGQALCDLSMNDFQAAFDRLEAAAKLAPYHPSILANLLHAATQTRHHDRAIEIARSIAQREELSGQLPVAWAILKRYCIWDEASALWPKALEKLLEENAPPELFASISLEILSSPDIDHALLKRLHVKCGDGLRMRNQSFPTPKLTRAFLPAKRMRIGYLSGDFRNHVVALFIRSVINHHDPGAFEIFLYSTAPVSSQDEVTGKFFRVSEHLLHCCNMDDGELAHRIADDGIHVLVELSGYTAHTRMPVLSLKPAPVQISYIGYPATYGLKEVDYILSTPVLTGSDHARAFVEEPLELPDLYAVCPSPVAVTRAAALPCIEKGHVTFGSLVNPYKINRETVDLWARVLNEVPRSHLYLNHPCYASTATRDSLLERLAMKGIAEERLTITAERPPEGSTHHVLYDNIDIVLDATPMTGGAGTMDAITVGVPVISRVGSIFHERLSALAIHANVPDPENFIAETDDEFVAKAASLAANPDRLIELRAKIRQTVLTGPNSQAEAFTRQLEAAYKTGWNRKFPDKPIDELVEWSQPTETLTVDHMTLEVSARRNDLHRFVAKDTGHWFEAECHFISRYANCLGVILDISHDPGLVVLPIASALGESGQLYCHRSTRHNRELLSRNLAANCLTTRAFVCDNIDASPAPTLVRIAAECNDPQASVVKKLLEDRQLTPAIFLVSIDSMNGAEWATANYLDGRGYVSFRYHTGAQVLISCHASVPTDSFTRNLFFVLPEAIDLLRDNGLMAEESPPDQVPDSTADHWRGYARIPDRTAPSCDPLYIAALNAYARSQGSLLDANERLRQFNFAEFLLEQLVLTDASVPKLFSLIRMKFLAGKRDEAIRLARQLADALSHRHGPVMSEPYLLPVDDIALLPVHNEDEAAWSHSVALITLERLRSLSPFFTAAESTVLWKELANLPWCQAMAAKKLALLAALWESPGNAPLS